MIPTRPPSLSMLHVGNVNDLFQERRHELQSKYRRHRGTALQLKNGLNFFCIVGRELTQISHDGADSSATAMQRRRKSVPITRGRMPTL